MRILFAAAALLISASIANAHHVRQYKVPGGMTQQEYQALLEWRYMTKSRTTDGPWYPNSQWVNDRELKAIVQGRIGRNPWGNAQCPTSLDSSQCNLFKGIAGQGMR